MKPLRAPLDIIDYRRGEVFIEHRDKKDPRVSEESDLGLWSSSCQALVLEGSKSVRVKRAVANERVSDG